MRRNQKGLISSTLYIIAFVVIAAWLVFIWNLQAKLNSIQVPVSPALVPTQKLDPTKNWKMYTNTELGLSLKYPQEWGVGDDMSISQFRNTNIISMGKITRQLFAGYYNIDLFEKLYSLKPDEKFTPEYFNNNQQAVIKIESGKLKDGNRYIIYATSANDISVKQPTSAMITFNDVMVGLMLNKHDDYGLETFKQIVRTAVLTSK